MSGGEDLRERVGVALRLYVAADSAPSVLARRQLELVRERLGGEDWELEVVDVFERPEVPEADGIVATPFPPSVISYSHPPGSHPAGRGHCRRGSAVSTAEILLIEDQP